ncbi:MAG: hypothetical protein ABR926_12795 [Streptosporangiaceae bacterium]|jgi:hypothetical protein
MSEILAEAGRITGLGPEISGKVTFGLQPAYAKLSGHEPMRFVASASQMADLSDEDLVVVRFSGIDNGTVSGPMPVVELSRA